MVDSKFWLFVEICQLIVISVTLIIAEFGASMSKFKAQQFHLWPGDNPECANDDGVVLRREVWDYHAASKAVKRKNRFRALGKVNGNKDFDETTRLLRLKSK